MISSNVNLLETLSLDISRNQPLYAQLVDELRGLVEAHFQDGDLFYSEKILVESLPVSQITIRRALRELTAEGLLAPGRGRGTIIRKKATKAAQIAVRSTYSSARQDKQQDELSANTKSLGIFIIETVLSLAPHAVELMREFERQSKQRDINLKFYEGANTTRLSQIFRSISGSPQETAFVLHTPSDLTHLLYHALDNRGYRTVALEGAGPDYPGHVIATDAMAAVKIGMDHLKTLGHRHIVLLVNEPSFEYNVQDKVHAFEHYLGEHDMDPLCRVVLCDDVVTDSSYGAAYQNMEEAVRGQSSQPTAIFTVSDPGAWAALKWCSQQGIRVPQDISILGFENVKWSEYMIPSLSSVAHPDEQLVKSTLDFLLGSGDGPARQILIPPKLVARESTAAVQL